jgi:hypothetical protein
MDFDSGDSNRGQGSPYGINAVLGPYCVSWDGARLWVADTGNRRVLMWDGLPQRNCESGAPGPGQADFDHRDENGGGTPTAASMRWPHAISFFAGGVCGGRRPATTG